MKQVRDAIRLVAVGATSHARARLKRLALPERMRALLGCVEHIRQSEAHFDFFRQHFAAELSALAESGWCPEEAAARWQLHRQSLRSPSRRTKR